MSQNDVSSAASFLAHLPCHALKHRTSVALPTARAKAVTPPVLPHTPQTHTPKQTVSPSPRPGWGVILRGEVASPAPHHRGLLASEPVGNLAGGVEQRTLSCRVPMSSAGRPGARVAVFAIPPRARYWGVGKGGYEGATEARTAQWSHPTPPLHRRLEHGTNSILRWGMAA